MTTADLQIIGLTLGTAGLSTLLIFPFGAGHHVVRNILQTNDPIGLTNQYIFKNCSHRDRIIFWKRIFYRERICFRSPWIKPPEDKEKSQAQDQRQANDRF